MRGRTARIEKAARSCHCAPNPTTRDGFIVASRKPDSLNPDHFGSLTKLQRACLIAAGVIQHETHATGIATQEVWIASRHLERLMPECIISFSNDASCDLLRLCRSSLSLATSAADRISPRRIGSSRCDRWLTGNNSRTMSY